MRASTYHQSRRVTDARHTAWVSSVPLDVTGERRSGRLACFRRQPYRYFHDTVNPAPKRGGQRVATVRIYLVDTEEGGETTFPNAKLPEHFEAVEENDPFASNVKRTDCAKRGIPVKSVRGDAILFFSMTSDGALDNGSLHGACPVVAGQKWTAVKWIRVAEFDGNFDHELPMIPLTRRTTEEPCVDEWSECAAWVSTIFTTKVVLRLVDRRPA
jgi:prolyl 4-hydroxylase